MQEIVARSLFGVDVIPLAVEIARMRLWLQLFAGAPPDLLQPGSKATLPNLSMRIRCGDSLVPQLDGVEVVLGRGRELIPADWAERIARWEHEKSLFFHNDPGCSYRTADRMLTAERALLSDLIDLPSRQSNTLTGAKLRLQRSVAAGPAGTAGAGLGQGSAFRMGQRFHRGSWAGAEGL